MVCSGEVVIGKTVPVSDSYAEGCDTVIFSLGHAVQHLHFNPHYRKAIRSSYRQRYFLEVLLRVTDECFWNIPTIVEMLEMAEILMVERSPS